MGDHPVGMRELPGREGVGREALVHEGERALEALVLQVLVVGPELGHEHHALVDDGARGQADRVVARGALVLEIVDRVRDHLAHDEEAPLERVHVGEGLRAGDEDLLVHGLGGLDRLAELGVVDRHVAPAEQRQALVLDRLLDDLLGDLPPVLVARHEEVADAVLAGLRQGDADRRALLGEEPVRDLDQDAAAVAHHRIGADGAPVGKVPEDREPLLDDGVRLHVLHVGDEADAAGVLLVLRVVESLARR